MDGDAGTISLTFDILLLDTIKRMRDYYADDDKERYYKYFEVALQLVLPHLDLEIRKGIEGDFKKLKIEEAKIAEVEANEQTRKIARLKLREGFATAHRYYIMLALTKVGIVKTSEEGLIDFNSIEIDTLKRVIRAGSGLPSSLKEAGLMPDKPEEKKEVAP
jgi:hypothetical protein